jgi:hypothetical protein
MLNHSTRSRRIYRLLASFSVCSLQKAVSISEGSIIPHFLQSPVLLHQQKTAILYLKFTSSNVRSSCRVSSDRVRILLPFKCRPNRCVSLSSECNNSQPHLPSSEFNNVKSHFVGFEVLAAVVMNFATIWNIAPFSPYVNRRFGGKFQLPSSWFQPMCEGTVRANVSPPSSC